MDAEDYSIEDQEEIPAASQFVMVSTKVTTKVSTA